MLIKLSIALLVNFIHFLGGGLRSARLITELRNDSPALPLTTILFYLEATLVKTVAFFISN